MQLSSRLAFALIDSVCFTLCRWWSSRTHRMFYGINFRFTDSILEWVLFKGCELRPWPSFSNQPFFLDGLSLSKTWLNACFSKVTSSILSSSSPLPLSFSYPANLTGPLREGLSLISNETELSHLRRTSLLDLICCCSSLSKLKFSSIWFAFRELSYPYSFMISPCLISNSLILWASSSSHFCFSRASIISLSFLSIIS